MSKFGPNRNGGLDRNARLVPPLPRGDDDDDDEALHRLIVGMRKNADRNRKIHNLSIAVIIAGRFANFLANPTRADSQYLSQ